MLRPRREPVAAPVAPAPVEPIARAETIDGAYLSVLGRVPGSAELPWAGSVWDDGRGAAALLSALLSCDEHKALLHGGRFVPPGHFYSPQPSDENIESVRRSPAERLAGIPGIDLRPDAQLDLLSRFAAKYPELPFQEDPVPGLRFHYGNPNYGFSDSIFLASMLREVRPARFIEVGSGDSSCALLDTNDRFFDGGIDITFIEPYPAYLKQLLGREEAQRIRLIESGLQGVALDEFERLQADDILFIDSTHVAKCGSDVNYLFFEILPRLKPGVYVHIHDVFAGFEYPYEWLVEGRAWNEQYLLRAFLQFNAAFEVVLFGNWAVNQYADWFAQHMPLCLRNAGGSIWLRRI